VPKTENLVGYLLALGAALTWPIYSLVKKRLPPTSVWAIGSFCFGAGVLCLLTHAWIEPRVVLQPADALKLLFMGAGPFGLAFYCWDAALARGDARVLGALAYLTPVLSTLGLVIFGGQELQQETLMAMVLIVLGASAGLLDFFPRNR
jgi:drug/metabolite transporter (DMT)-like permease